MEGIKLVNIDLSGINELDQGLKMIEEYEEFRESIADYILDKNEKFKVHVIEEYFDMLQSALGLMDKLGIPADEVMQGYPKHLKKMKVRPRQKKCSDCFYKKNCCLFNSEHWQGDQEAENCQTFDDGVR